MKKALLIKEGKTNGLSESSSTAIIYNNIGSGKLAVHYGVASDNKSKMVISINNIPLNKWGCGKEYNCPTCEKLIAAGYCTAFYELF